MKKYENSDNQIDNLEEQLDELISKSEKILGYNSENVNQIVEDLLSTNTEEASALAADIMDLEEDLILTEEFYSDEYFEDEDDPFSNLYDEDTEEI